MGKIRDLFRKIIGSKESQKLNLSGVTGNEVWSADANEQMYEQYNPDSLAQEFENSGELQNYYKELRKIIQDKDKYYPSNIKGIEHTARVTMFAMILAKLDNISAQDKKLLLLAARYHDIGRYNDNENANYGDWSIKKIEGFNLLEGLSQEDIRIIEFAIQEHAKPLNENAESLRRIPFWKREKYKIILNYLKDAETLDKVGDFEGNIQEVSPELISESSKKLISFAHKVDRTFFKEKNSKKSEESKAIQADTLKNKKDVLEYMEVSGGTKYLFDVLNMLKKDATYDSKNFTQLEDALKKAFWIINIGTLENFSHTDINILLRAVVYESVHNSESNALNSDVPIDKDNMEYDFLKDYSVEDKQLIKFLVEQYKQGEDVNIDALRDVVFFRRKKYEKLLNCLKDAQNLKMEFEGQKKIKGLREFRFDWDTSVVDDKNELRLDSSKKLKSLATNLDISIVMLDICKKMIPGFEEACKVFDKKELSAIFKGTCSSNIVKFIVQIEEWRRRGVLDHYREEELELCPSPYKTSDFDASNQIEKGDYESILEQGYEISYKEFLEIINMYPVGVLEKLRTEKRIVDIFSYDTFSLYDKRDWYKYGLADYYLLENLQRRIFEPQKKSEVRKDFLLYKLKYSDSSRVHRFNSWFARCFWKVDIKKGKDYFEDINQNSRYEGSVDDDKYQKLLQCVRENGFDVEEEEFKEKFKYYEFMFSTNIDMKMLKGYDISKVYNIYNMLCYAVEQAKLRNGIEINIDINLVCQLLNWDLDKYDLENFEKFEIVYGIVTQNPVTKDSRLLNYLNNKYRFHQIRYIGDLENYNAYCLDHRAAFRNHKYKNRHVVSRRDDLVESFLGSFIPEECKSERAVFESLLKDLYFYQKYKRNGDFDGFIEDSEEEREIDQVVSELLNLIDDNNNEQYRNIRLLREKYIDIPRIIKLINKRMEYVSRKNIVEELAKTKRMIENLPVQYEEHEGEMIPVKVLDGQDFCLATSTLMPNCSGIGRYPQYENDEKRLEHILNWPLNTRHRRVSFINQDMLVRAVPVSSKLDVMYAYFPDSPESIEMTADRDLSTRIVKNKEDGDSKVVSAIGINQNRKVADIINSTGYAEHNEGVLDNVLPSYITCYDQISETALKKYKLLKEQGHNVELLVIKAKEKYIPQMEARFDEDISIIKSEMSRTKTLSQQTMDKYFNEHENNMCIRALQICLTGKVSIEKKLPQLRDLLMDVAQCIPREYISALLSQIDIICELERKMNYGGVCNYPIFGSIKREKFYSEECFENVKERLRNRLNDNRDLENQY